MSMLTKIKSVPRNLPSGLESGVGLMPFVKDKGERLIFSAGLGYLKARFREKLTFKGVGYEAYLGVLGYLGSAFLGGNKHLERLGDAAAGAYAYTMGASLGADHADTGVAVTAPKKKAVVGVIPPRADGAFLTAAEIANNSRPRV